MPDGSGLNKFQGRTLVEIVDEKGPNYFKEHWVKSHLVQGIVDDNTECCGCVCLSDFISKYFPNQLRDHGRFKPGSFVCMITNLGNMSKRVYNRPQCAMVEIGDERRFYLPGRGGFSKGWFSAAEPEG